MDVMKFVSPLLAGVGLISHLKPKLPAPIAQATRDDASMRATLADDLARRRGGAADMMTGAGGAEAGAGAKQTLGS